TVLIVDASLSTARKTGDDRRVFDDQIAAAGKALAALGEHDTVRILLATDAPRWLTPSRVEATPANRDALRSMLETLKPTAGSSDLPLAVGEALHVPPAPACVSRRLFLFTDGTERPWRGDDPLRWAAIEKALKAAPVPAQIEVLLPPPGSKSDRFSNLAVDRLTADHEIVAAGETVLLTAEIRNHATRLSRPGKLVWEVDGREVGSTALATALEPGASTTVEYAVPCDAAGSHVARCTLAAEDLLDLDNEASVAVRALDEIPLLIVDGARRPKTHDVAEAGFFLAALGHSPKAGEPARARSAFQARVIGPKNSPRFLSTRSCA
ncbi:MAG: VWA domain-containing protein, partial [Verrucomicrobiota bacterium]|nr:VWA domain-containing protein [Verrucomicrobiota bacterium]